MKTGRILHQQIVQLRGHFLACLGLMMALPIEEAIINLREGEGFYGKGLRPINANCPKSQPVAPKG